MRRVRNTRFFIKYSQFVSEKLNERDDSKFLIGQIAQIFANFDQISYNLFSIYFLSICGHIVSMSEAQSDIQLVNQGLLVIKHYGPTYHHYGLKLDKLICGEKLNRKRKLQDMKSEPETKVADRPASTGDLAVSSHRRMSVVHPDTGVKLILYDPQYLSKEEQKEFDLERKAVYKEYGRKSKRDSVNEARKLELGKIWCAYNEKSEDRKRALLASSA